MAIIRNVMQNSESGKWAYCEYSDEDRSVFKILGGEEFNTRGEAIEFSKRFVENENKQNFPGGFSFGKAVELLKNGSRVQRKGWNGKGMYLQLVGQETYSVESTVDVNLSLLPWIGIKTADNKFVPWLASQTDILSEDWEIFVEKI